jgi:hypothetical protein
MEDAPVPTKICNRCPEGHNVKPVTEFTQCISYHDGYLPYCKTCQRRKDGREAMQAFRAYHQLLSQRRRLVNLYIRRLCLRHSFSTHKSSKALAQRVQEIRLQRGERDKQEKVCRQCQASKQRKDFSFDITKQDGRAPVCKTCASAYLQDWLAIPGNRAKTLAWAAEQRVRNADDEEWHIYLRGKIAEWGRNNRDKTRLIEHRYRAKKSGANFVEDVEIDILYSRDKGMCSICLKHVDKRLKFPHPMSPSVEHVIPVSKPGSEHSYRNTALAHLVCNQRKNNGTVTQQMRLF